MNSRLVAVLTCAAMTLSVAGSMVLSRAPHAIAASSLPVHISIDTLAPSIPQPKDVLRISGRLLSSSLESLTGVSVQLRRARVPATSRTELAAALAAPLDSVEPDSIVVPGTSFSLGSAITPGSVIPFSITVPIKKLRMTESGAWIIGVEVVSVDGAGSTTRIGEQRTVLPIYLTAPQALDITWLWPLANWPARTANGVLLTDQTPVDVSPDGRLDRQLSAAERNPGELSWVIDPALVQTVKDMSDGYQVLVNGSPTMGDRQQQAHDWLQRLTKMTRKVSVYPLPYADVDASALVRGGLTSDVVSAVTQGPAIMRSDIAGTLASPVDWAPYGRFDAAAADVLATAGVTAMILPADAFPTTDPASGATTAIQTPHGNLTGVLVDPRLSELTDPSQPADPVLLRQEFLADTALIASGMSPLRRDRGLVIAPRSVTWSTDPKSVAPLIAALNTTPWLHSRSLQNLLRIPTDGAQRTVAPYGSRARAAELPSSYVARIGRTTSQISAMTAIVDDPAELAEPYRQALLRSASATWRTQPDVGSALLAATGRSVSAQIAQIHVLSSGTVTLSGDAGRVPITIANESDHDVVVGVELRGNPSIRLRSTAFTGIHIPAGQKASLDISAQVIGADVVPVDVQLLTPQGQDYGQAARISVTSTTYARAASWVMIAAFAAILVFVVVGVTRRIRNAGRTAGKKDA